MTPRTRTLVVLVRGVTPSGTNCLPVAAWREAMADAGFARHDRAVARARGGGWLTP